MSHIHIHVHRRGSLEVTGFDRIAGWLRAADPIDAGAERPTDAGVPFDDLWVRIAKPAVDELRCCSNVHSESVWDDVVGDLVAQLADVGEPTLWAEFNRHRTPADVVAALLSEQSARSRSTYCLVLEMIRADGMTALNRCHPMLGHHLESVLRGWGVATRALLTRIEQDDDAIRAAFAIPRTARLNRMRQGLADPHPGGRTVVALSYDEPNGARTYRVAYKAKDLRIDRAFADVLARLPAPTPDDGRLRAPKVLIRDGYGYMEWIEHVACETDDELAVFYRNAGRLTAVLHLLACNDCHHANLIAHRDQLVMIDGETLFEGVPDTAFESESARPTELQRRIDSSVLALGILPQWHVAGAERAVRDMSALGIEQPATARRRITAWVGLNTDAMISGEVEKDATIVSSLPVGIGSPNRFADFIDDFCNGFGEQLRALYDVKLDWVTDGPLTPFRGLVRRFVRRPTWVYLWTRSRLLEPSALTSPGAQAAALNALRDDVTDTDRRAAALTAAETSQLADLHVPLFEHVTDRVDVYEPGGVVIPDFYQTSGYENVLSRFRDLEPSSITLQLNLIRGVTAAKRAPAHGAPAPAESPTEPADPLTTARAMADRLLAAAIHDADGSVEWLGIHVTRNMDLTNYGAVGPGLYSGRAGIALFLDRFARRCDASDGQPYRDAALAALGDLAAPPRDGHRWWRDRPLGLAGSGGILLVLQRFAGLAGDLLDDYLSSLEVERLTGDDPLDVIFGVSGLIGPLLGIGTPAAMALARIAGDHLVDRQHPSGGWLPDSTAHRPLTGFSHGAAGMAAALGALHTTTGDDRYLSAAAKAVRYEREQFDASVGNWPDYRGSATQQPRFMRSWCHGAPGIAVSRLCLVGSPLWDDEMYAELATALQTTSNVAPHTDSLCCGRLGRAAILRLAARLLNQPRWLLRAEDLEQAALAGRIGAEDYRVTELPGLFQGAAGIGLALIDCAAAPALSGVLSAGLLDYADILRRPLDSPNTAS